MIVEPLKASTVFFLFLVLSFPSFFVDAGPYWVKKGVYAVYSFKNAYTTKGFGEYGWEFISVGGGYYMWEILEVDGDLAVLNVTLKTGNLTRNMNVTINTETMDLVDEEGRVWGKAWLWIDLVKLPATDMPVVRNITLVMKWLNETLKNPYVSPIYSSRNPPNVPIKTGLGPVDKVVGFLVSTNLTRWKFDNVTSSMMLPEGIGEKSGLPLQWNYEAKYGLMIEGLYMDDILSQRFKTPYFKELPSVIPGEEFEEDYPYPYWIRLNDTNLDIEITSNDDSMLNFFRKYFLQIFFIVLASLFVLAFIRGRKV